MYSLYSLAVVVKVVISLRLLGSVVKLHSVPSTVYNHANHHILIMRLSEVWWPNLPGTVVRSPHEEQFRQNHQEGVPHPGRHLVCGRGPDRVISYQTVKLRATFYWSLQSF